MTNGLRVPTRLDHTVGTPKCCCPHCGANLDHVAGDAAPRPGDVTLRIECTGVLKFRDDLSVRELTVTKDLELSDNPVVKQLRRLIRKAKS